MRTKSIYLFFQNQSRQFRLLVVDMLRSYKMFQKKQDLENQSRSFVRMKWPGFPEALCAVVALYSRNLEVVGSSPTRIIFVLKNYLD